MERLRRHPRSWRVLMTVIALALCAATSYAAYALASYFVSTEVDTLVNRNLGSYQNTSPPLAASAGGVTLALEHSRYLTLETITVTLTNHSATPIYVAGATMTSARTVMLCWFSRVEYLSAHGWRAVGSGCGWSPTTCQGGAAPSIPYLAVGSVAPGETIILDSYDGQDSYPPLSSGSYRFSVEYSPTPFQAPYHSGIPDGVTLTTAPVTLTSAWWIPPWYHQKLDCPKMPA